VPFLRDALIGSARRARVPTSAYDTHALQRPALSGNGLPERCQAFRALRRFLAALPDAAMRKAVVRSAPEHASDPVTRRHRLSRETPPALRDA